MSDQRTFRAELAARFPLAAARAETSRAVAVRLFCIECTGGSVRDAASCQAKECFLWPHAYRKQRTGARVEPTP